MNAAFRFLVAATACLLYPAWAQAQDAGSASLSITTPVCGGKFKCSPTRGTQCFITVKGTASGLKSGDYVSLLMQLQGGVQWWVGGNSVAVDNIHNNSWTIGMVGLDTNSITKDFVALAVATNYPMQAGKQYNASPSSIVSPSCDWTLDN
jgi:hypothetical protein